MEHLRRGGWQVKMVGKWKVVDGLDEEVHFHLLNESPCSWTRSVLKSISVSRKYVENISVFAVLIPTVTFQNEIFKISHF